MCPSSGCVQWDVNFDDVAADVVAKLDEIQANLLNRARAARDEKLVKVTHTTTSHHKAQSPTAAATRFLRFSCAAWLCVTCGTGDALGGVCACAGEAVHRADAVLQ